MKSIRILSVAAAAVLALSACGGADKPTATRTTPALTGEPIIFGVQQDSHGPAAAYSPIAAKTIKHAADQINEQGGLLGRPVKVIVEEDESDPTKAPSVARKLIDGGAHVLFTTTSSAAIVQTKAVAQQAKKPNMAALALTPSLVSPPDHDYMYTLANPLADWTQVYCGAFKAKGYQKLAVLSDASVTIQGLQKVLMPEFAKCINVVANESAPVDTADLNAQVAKIKAADPDVVLVDSVGGNFEVLAQTTLSQQLPKVQRFSVASIGNQPDTWKLAQPGAFKGMVFMGSLDTANNDRTKQLQKFLAERNGEKYQMTAYDAQAWDSVQMVKRAIQKSNSTDGEKINQALQSGEPLPSSFGGANFQLTFTSSKHLGSNGLCGLVLTEFGSNNKPEGPWAGYQPPCK
ncbi:ABC transporter substrate-binding protein [Enemella dayhoffiae]|uniref:ABC transporter substrate-binding protein n=1 Tax=Enemella dayhoffiae TaxID=2016507 RepID=A0A255GL60_9ACTN|nr:ABC transporter substrate-binding protein [Enemella dayhoffiae]OYO16565.1 ABC transporter substrate-binding protein [Enemella dayhoffiae]